jgi:thiol-disulfide isomerase/thioredoxin
VSNRPNKRTSSRVSAARADANRNRTVWIVVGAAVVVLLAAVIAIAARGGGDDSASLGGGPSPSGGTVVPSGDLDYGTVQVSGTPLAQAPRTAATADPAIGQTIPTVTGQQFDGSSITLAPGDKPKVVVFAAHWCPHCQAEVPRIQEWLDADGMPADVELTAVATGTTSTRPNFPPGKWLRSKGCSIPTLVDDEESTAANAFGLASYPFFVVVDGSGKVVYRVSGEISEDTWNSLLEAARTGVAPGTATGGESSSAG